MNIANFVTIPAAMLPDQEILIFEGQRSSYQQVAGEIQRLAAAFRQLGITRGDAVAILQTSSARYVECMFAAAASGATFVPLNYRAKPGELEYMIRAAQVKLLLVGDRYAAVLRELAPTLPGELRLVALESPQAGMTSLADLLCEAAPIEEQGDDDDVSILMYTSGTTARPKAVLLTHNHFTVYVCNNVELADGSDRGTALLCVPLYHIAGTTNVMTSLFAGRRLVLMRQFDAGEWLRLVAQERVTHAFLVPTMVKQLLAHPDFKAADLSSLQNISYGGAAMPFPVIRRALETFPPSVGFVNAFGQTETTSTLTVLGPEDHRIEGTAAEVEAKLRRLHSIGRPLPDVELKVVDEQGNALDTDLVGELWVRTERSLKGYGTETGSESPLRDGWLPTRDMGWIDAAGYVFLAGRKDDMIIRGGENIAPAEIESVLYSHPEIEEAAVLGVADEEWGQRVVACIALRRDGKALASEVIAFCKQRLATFKTPETIHFLDELPRNALGKVLKTELARVIAARTPAAGER